MLHTVSTPASEHAAQMNQKVFGALVVVVSTLSADREELFISDGCLVRTVYREEEKHCAIAETPHRLRVCDDEGFRQRCLWRGREPESRPVG